MIRYTGKYDLTRGSEAAAGFDLRNKAGEDVTVAPGGVLKIPTGISVALPTGTCGIVTLRSGMWDSGLIIPNSPGIIDSDYRGEIFITLHNIGEYPRTVFEGNRIAQLVVTTVVTQACRVHELSDTTRGFGGFGSSGVS